MTEFMISVVSLGIVGCLTYLIISTHDQLFGWALVGFIVTESLTAVYALLYNLHGGDDGDDPDQTRSG